MPPDRPRPASSVGHVPTDTRSSGTDADGVGGDPPVPAKIGPYEVLRVIGRGGMGIVYECREAALNRTVAVKQMLPGYAGQPQHKARFVREARAQAAVEHDHIIPIYRVGEAGGAPFLAMPLLKGGTLADYLKPGRPPVGEAVRIGREMADGLAAAHAAGLVHRDIKPGNVALDGPRRRVKLLDFGLAKPVDTRGAEFQSHSGAVVGTPAYMSPEQARGQHVDARTDLFALGVVLYEMLTGGRPFLAPDLISLMSALALDTPAEPQAVNPAVPAELGRLVMKLLEKKPENRPADAEAVSAELRAVEGRLSGVQVVAVAGNAFAELGTGEKPTATAVPVKGKPWGLVAAGVGLVLVVGVLAGVALRPATPKEPVAKAEEPPAVVRAEPPKTPTTGVAALPGFRMAYGLTADALKDWAAAQPAGWRLDWVSAARTAGGARFDAVAVPDPANPECLLHVRPADDKGPGGIVAYWKGMTEDRKFRPLRLAHYSDGGSRMLAVLWLKDGQAGRSTMVPAAGVAELHAQMTADGLGPVSLSGIDAGRRMVDYVGGPGERGEAAVELTAGELAARLEAGRAAGLVPVSVTAHYSPDPVRFHAALVPRPDVADWAFVGVRSAAELVAEAGERAADGYRPQCVCSWEADGVVRYAAVWVKPASPAASPASPGPSFAEIHGAGDQQLKAWAEGLPAGLVPTWVAVRAGAAAPTFDAVAVPDPVVSRFKLVVQPSAAVDAQFDEMRASGWAVRSRTLHRDAGGWAEALVWEQRTADRWTGTWKGMPGHVASKMAYEATKGAAPMALHAAADGTDYRQVFVAHTAANLGYDVTDPLDAAGLAAQVKRQTDRGWWPRSVSAVTVNGAVRYLAVFAPQPPAAGWQFAPQLTVAEYERQLAARRAAGGYPQAVCSAVVGGQVRYTAVWVGPKPADETATLAPVTGSPFDRLRRADIPAAKLKAAGSPPPEVVAILGDSRPRTAGRAGHALAVTRDGSTVAFAYVSAPKDGGRNEVALWDVATGKETTLTQTKAISLEFAPDGKTLAVAPASDEVRLWDVAARKPTGPVLAAKQARAKPVFAFTPDGKTLAFGRHMSTEPAALWSLADPAAKPVPLAGGPNFGTLALSPDGGTVAVTTADPDERDHLLQLWAVPSGKLLKEVSGVQARLLTFAPGGRLLVVRPTRSEVRVLDAADPARERAVFTGHAYTVGGLSVGPDGKSVASLDTAGVLLVWDADTLAVRHRLPLNPPLAAGDDKGALGAAYGLRWAPDGRHLLTRNADGTVYVVRLPAAGSPFDRLRREDMKTAGSLPPEVVAVLGRPQPTGGQSGHALAVSGDGATVALGYVGGSRNEVTLWDVAAGKETTLTQSKALALEFAPDGRTLAVAPSGDEVRLWDVATRKPTGPVLADKSVRARPMFAFTPDGKTLAFGRAENSEPTVLVSLAGSAPLQLAHDPNFGALALSPDGATLAVASGVPKERVAGVRLFAVPGGTLLGEVSNLQVRAMAFGPAGRLFVISPNQFGVRVLDAADLAKERRTLTAHARPVGGLAVSPDGKVVASLDVGGLLLVWDADTFAVRHRVQLAPAVGGDERGAINWLPLGLRWAPDGRHVLARAADGTVSVVRLPAEAGSPFDRLRREDIPAEKLKAAGSPPPEVVAILGTSQPTWGYKVRVSPSPDGRLLAVGYQIDQAQRVALFDPAANLQRALVAGPEPADIQFTPDGRGLAVAVVHGPSGVYDLATRKLRQPFGPGSGGQCVAVDPAGGWAVVGHGRKDAGSLAVYPLAGDTPAVPLAAPPGVHRLALSPDGNTLAVGQHAPTDKAPTVGLWDVAGRKLLRTLRVGPTRWGGLAFTRDGKTLLVTRDDAKVYRFDVATGDELEPFVGHPGTKLNSVSVGPDGTAASCDWAGNVVLWDADTRQVKRRIALRPPFSRPLGKLDLQGGVLSVEWLPDGRHLAACNADGTVYIVRLTEQAAGSPFDRLRREDIPKAAGELPPEAVGVLGDWYGVATEPHPIWATHPSGSPVALTYSTGTGRRNLLWDVATGTAKPLTGPKPAYGQGNVRYSPDGRRLFVGGDEAGVWDVATGALVRKVSGRDNRKPMVAFTPDGNWLLYATARPDPDPPTLYRLDDPTAPPVPLADWPADKVCSSLAVSPDGASAAVGCDAGRGGSWVKLWAVPSGKPLGPVSDGHRFACDLSFAAGGRLLVHGLEYQSPVARFDVAAGKPLPPFTGHAADVRGLAVHPDGAKVATGDAAGVVKVWDADTLAVEQTVTFPGKPAVTQLIWADGRHLVARTDRGALAVLRLGAPPATVAVVPPDLAAGAAEFAHFREAHGLTAADLRKWADALPAGWRPSWVAARAGASLARFDVIAVPNPANHDWAVDVMPAADEPARWKEMTTGKGYRLAAHIAHDGADGRPAVALLWVRDRSPFYHWGGSPADVAKVEAEWRGKGYRPVYLAGVDRGGPRLNLALVHAPKTAGRTAVLLTADELRERVAAEQANGFVPWSITAHLRAGPPRFHACFADNWTKGTVDWSPDLSAAEYAAELTRRAAGGSRPLSACSWVRGDEVRYAAVWADPPPAAVPPNARTDRPAVDALRPHWDVAVRTDAGDTVTVKRGGQLPAGKLLLREVVDRSPNGPELPEGYVDRVFLPAVRQCPDLHVLDAQNYHLRLSEAQALQLLGGQARRLGNIGGASLLLTSEVVAALKRYKDAAGSDPVLTTLSLDADVADDALIARAAKLPGVGVLWLYNVGHGPRLAGPGLAAVGKMPLTYLAMHSSRGLTATDLKLVSAGPKLNTLDLGWGELADDAAAGCADMPCPNLDLHGTNLTDLAVPHLLKLKRLKWLSVDNTKLTEGGAKKLAAGLPGCEVYWGGKVVKGGG